MDTMVQDKNVRFPTDARLYGRAKREVGGDGQAKRIETAAESYVRVGKHLRR